MKNLIACSLEKLMTLSKIELRPTCTQLLLPDSSNIVKYSLIKMVCDATLDNYGNTTNGMLSEIDNEDELDSKFKLRGCDS